MRRYVLHEGTIFSRSDGDVHFISCSALMHLYKLRREECIFDCVDDNPPYYLAVGPTELRLFIHLYPQENGDYTLPLE